MEFIVCLIPLIFILSGLILIAVLGRANVKCTINSRSMADLGISSGKAEAQEILFWDHGKDQIPFTVNDAAITGAQSYLIANDLDTSVNTVSGTFDKNLKLQDMYDGEYVSEMPGRINFTKAANLTGSKVKVDDVLTKKNMKFFARLFQLHLKSFHVNLHDTTFMPEGEEAQYELN